MKVQQTRYQLHILYLSTGNTETLNNRIRKRTLLGDHFVSPKIVEERYINSLKLLDHYFEKADKLQLFDNSQYLQLIVEINYGKIIFQVNPLPDWVTSYLGKHFRPKLKEEKSIRDMTIDEVRKNYLTKKRDS